MADQANESAGPARRRHQVDVALGWLSVVCCTPAILGVLGSVAPLFTRHWSLETPWDRALVGVFTWSTVVALLSPPATIIGFGVGVWAIRRAGWSARLSKAIAGSLGCAVLLTIGGAGLMYERLHRGPNPAAEQPVASLPAPIRALHDSCYAGDASSCARVAAKYDLGEELPRSGTVAARYYVRGCDLGESNSCMNGGTLFFYGGADPSPDPVQGLKMLERACELGHPLGCLKIGIVYKLGHGVQSDAVAARAYFERACKLGLSDGCKWSKEIPDR